jgi:hypothetical protein
MLWPAWILVYLSILKLTCKKWGSFFILLKTTEIGKKKKEDKENESRTRGEKIGKKYYNRRKPKDGSDITVYIKWRKSYRMAGSP